MEKTSSLKKAPLKTHRVLDPIKTSPFVVPTTITKEAPTEAPVVSQQSTKSQPPRLVPRSEKPQEQGFSVEVAERIAAPHTSSARTIYKSKWALFEKWCREN